MIAIPRLLGPNGPAPPTAAGFNERLQDLPPATAAALLAVGSRRHWKRGQTVLRQGEHSDALTVALQGRLAARLGRADGSDTLLRWLDDGELVGLPDVLAHQPSPVSIVAQGPAQTLHVDRAAFIDVLQRHPDGAIGVAMLLARRLGELFRYVELNSARPLADRVDFALRRLARSQGQPDGRGGVRLQLTQAELATAAGASRQRVHLALRQLQRQGRVALGYGAVTLLAGSGWALEP
jgi:CRP-like cAMP-binding protein